jgi:hypothetical protein
MQLPEVDLNALATGVGGFGVLRLVEGLAKLAVGRLRDRDAHVDKRADRESDDRRHQEEAEAAVRDELRRQVTGLYERCDTLTERLDRSNERILTLVGEVAKVKAENHLVLAQSELIRAENHMMRNYMTTLIVTAQRYHTLLGFPPEDRPTVPSWLLEPRPLSVDESSATAPSAPRATAEGSGQAGPLPTVDSSTVDGGD